MFRYLTLDSKIAKNGFQFAMCGTLFFFTACGSKSSSIAPAITVNTAASADTVAPSFVSKTSLSDISSTSALVSWSVASDAITAETELEYRVVYALDELPIDLGILGRTTPPTGVVIGKDWNKNLTSATIANLSPQTSYQIAVLVRDSSQNMAMLSPKLLTTNAVFSPTTGAIIAFTDIKSSSVTLSWGVASDNVTTNAALLQYKLVKAADPTSLDTLAKVESITGTDLLLDWTPNVVSKNLTALTPATTYNFAVLVKNEAGNKSLYMPSTMTTLVSDVIVAYSSCVDNSLNASQCSAAANRYVTQTLGGNITVSSSLSALIAAGYYNGSQTCNVSDVNLIAANIKAGISILGITGSLPFLISNMARDKGITQITQAAESAAAGTSYANDATGYRAVPKIAKDDDGSTATNVILVNRASFANCGTSQATLDLRIADCSAVNGVNATWDGTVNGNAGQRVWKLVARTGASLEVWRDEQTKLLWSSRVSTGLNWCKASGSNYITGNPTAEDDPNNYCDNVANQNTAGKAVSACFEDGEVNFTTSDAGIDNAAKAGLMRDSTPRVDWRLPTKYDYQMADNDGFRFVLPGMLDVGGGLEWTASIYSADRSGARQFNGSLAGINWDPRNSSRTVRCVGR